MIHQTSTRAGNYVKQPTGYRAFIPSALPPDPRIEFDDALLEVLSRADRALQAVRDTGQWEPWLKFFLRGIAEVAEEATMTARKIVQLREQHRKPVAGSFGRSAGRALNLLESLYGQPVVSMSTARHTSR